MPSPRTWSPADSGLGAHDAPRVTAIVVAFDRSPLVDRCLESLVDQDEPSFEVVVVLNGATPRVQATVRGLANEDPRVRVVACRRTTASEARNAGVLAARGSLLYFLDDDVEVPPDGLRKARELFDARPDLTIAGGPNLTPPDDPDFSQMAGEVLASRFGTGIAHSRYAPEPEHRARERHLTLCNLVVARALFDAGARFPRWFGGEENVLMGRAAHQGHGLWYSPELWVHHRRRSTLPEHLHQVERYGFGRAIAIHSAPGTFHLAYLAPVGLLGCLAFGLPAAVLGSPAWLSPIILYGVLAYAASLVIALRRRRLPWLARLPGLFALTHLAYAVGLLRGVARVLRATLLARIAPERLSFPPPRGSVPPP